MMFIHFVKLADGELLTVAAREAVGVNNGVCQSVCGSLALDGRVFGWSPSCVFWMKLTSDWIVSGCGVLRVWCCVR